MRALIVDRPGVLRAGEVPDPTPGHGEVIVEVDACGICGTDLHILDGEFPPAPYPLVPGHEFAGRVAALGPGAGTGLEVGQRVAVDPSLFCGHCAACRAGRGNLCEFWGATGDTVDGAFAEYVAVPAANAHPLPDHLSSAAGAMVEPLSCAVHGVRRLGPVLGETVLLVGAGTMGLLLQQLLLAAGARRLVVVDRNAERLAVAARLGATATATSVGELDGERFDAAVDVTGVPAAIEDALSAVRRGGRLLIFGVAAAEARIAVSPFRIYNDEITVIGSMAVLHSYAAALDLAASGQVELDPLVTASFGLDDHAAAFRAVRTGAGVKTQITPRAAA
ncbi:zinc-dependent alcohol dehydrogenase family protein [Streptomyces hoynatensis]|uniref:2-deoxy-scyllo-inosamine dehydrogenase n=1 Tax=Streptomyces hoynatensis TaxID=1141874 RepID=A0A3A9YW98_9ACTN|nr:zinc-dependent alcohol dehydrogenase family protein [Streptomyces hoynatensis]RKN40059.1 alcohol dehydrogenase [Streptomyces hoynatensis]